MDIYKIKYIKYKKKYNELEKLYMNKNNIIKNIILLPKEYKILNPNEKLLFEIYETDKYKNPISYINKNYLTKIPTNINIECIRDSSSEEINNILEKQIITPDEYFLLADSDKAKYQIYECDYYKFPHRVLPKNYIKI